MINVEVSCPFCGVVSEVVVPFDGFMEWKAGTLIQKALPTLSVTKREMLISGICPKCQASVFNSDEEEEEDVGACERESLEFMGQWW